MIERLMLLDAVLDDGEFMWRGTEADKSRYLFLRLAEYRFARGDRPHLTFGSGANKALRLFPDKFPIGVDPIGDRHVFTYLITRSAPVDVRAFLLRRVTMLKALHQWTLRLIVPERFEKAIPVYRHVVREELATPIQPSNADELRGLFEQRKRVSVEPAFVPDRQFVDAAQRFGAPRFKVLYRLWLRHGNEVLWNTYSTLLVEQFDRGLASVEVIVLSRQYLHLGHLVGVA